MNGLLRYCELVSKALASVGATIGAILMALMTLLITVDVLGRIVRLPTYLSDEFSGYMLVGITFLALGYTQRKNKHVSIEFVTSRFPQRVQNKFQLISFIIAVVFSGLATWFTLIPVVESFSFHVTSLTFMHTPLWIIRLFIPVGFAMFTLELICELIKFVVAGQPVVPGGGVLT